MTHVTRRTRRPAALWAGAVLALAAAPQAAFSQAVDSYLRPGAVSERPGQPVGQTIPQRTSSFSGRPTPGGTPSQEGPSPGLPFRTIQRSANPVPYPTIVVTGQAQFGNSNAPTQPQSDPYEGGGNDGNVFSNQYYNNPYPNGGGNNYYGNGGLPPVGPANGFIPNPLPPVGPANGFGPSSFNGRPTSERGPQRFHRPVSGDGYVYSTINTDPILAGSVPPLLGGYYYGNYCDSAYGIGAYPSVYSVYSGFPQFIYSPGVIVDGQPYAPVYETTYAPFNSPNYTVTYNNTNYYVANADRAQQLDAGGDQAREALKNAYPADSFQAAFADVARAWTDGDVQPLRRHVRDSETRISVSLNGKYSYSIASSDFIQITRDALSRLHTVSFEFTHVRKAKNGDVTAYGKHVYRASDPATGAGDANDGQTVPFDQAGTDAQTAPSDGADGDAKTVYVSYTLRRQDGRWNVIALDSSDHSLVPSDAR